MKKVRRICVDSLHLLITVLVLLLGPLGGEHIVQRKNRPNMLMHKTCKYEKLCIERA